LAKNILLSFDKDAAPESFLTPSGSDANRIAIQLARYYQHAKGQPFRKVLVSHQAHAGIIGSLGADAVFFPVDTHNKYQPDSEKLLQLLDQHPDCRIIILTAPTTNFNIVECLSEEVMEVVRERDIWVHIDGALSQILGILPTRQSARMRGLISSKIVRSFSYNAHKIVGLPAIGVLILPWAKDKAVLGDQLRGPPYICTGTAETLSTTSMDHGRYVEACMRLEELGAAGCHFLLISAYTAALTLAKCLEDRGVELFTEPQTHAVSIKIRSYNDLFTPEYFLRFEFPVKVSVARIPSTEINGEVCDGMRVVLPLGVHWNFQSLDYLAELISQAIKRADYFKSFNKDGSSHNFELSLPVACRRDMLLEVPRSWVNKLYDTFTPEINGVRERRVLNTEAFLEECRLFMEQLAAEETPKPSRILSKRARVFRQKHKLVPPEELLVLPR
jgi:hypothetical protein